MEILKREESGIMILSPTGKMTITNQATDIYTEVKELLQDGHSKIIVDMGKISFVDSSGLGQLIAIRSAVQNKKGTLVLAALTPNTEELMKITKLLSVFSITPTIQEAINTIH